MSKRDIPNNKNKGSKVKKKMALAKNKNEAILAIVIFSFFILFSIYNIVMYFVSQQAMNAPARTTQQQSQMMAEKGDKVLSKDGANGTPADPNQPNPDQNVQQNNPANPETMKASQSVAPSTGVNPIIPILLILLVAGIIYAIAKYLTQNANFGGPPVGNKKGAKKKMALAKNKNEAVLAISVFSFFILFSIYNLAMYIKSQQPVTQASQPNQQTAEMMAKSQQKNLESLNQDPANPVDPSANPNVAQDANDIYSKTMSMQNNGSGGSLPPNQVGNASRGTSEDIEIMSRKPRSRSGKMVMISVADSGRSNPFLPAAENVVPSSLPKFNLLQPPETVSTGSDADNVMGTTISGILYDKYSPSAIINIGGTDYLVKRGDVINRYKILTINKDQVTVQLGKNIYKAGVGQILEQSPVNYNTIANLNKKFAGNSVSVGVRKKGY